MKPINTDVIALIISNVEDKGTLFSLLTVNTKVFRLTCSVLYRDPFRFCRDQQNSFNDSMLESKQSLVRLLLSLSPATDHDTNLIRNLFGVPLKGELDTNVQPATMLDYLSLIQIVRWETFLDHPAFRFRRSVFEDDANRHPAFFRSAMLWSICGHRLDQMRELEIEADDIGRLVDMAPNLCRLRYLTIVSSETPMDVYPSAVRLIEALQHVHGKHQLRDCQFDSRHNGNSADDAFAVSVGLRKLLCPLFPPGLNVAQPLRPMDAYLSRLTNLTTQHGVVYHWDELAKEYSDLSVGQILQRCRSLNSLCLLLEREDVKDTNLLTWAVDEAIGRATGRLLVPAVPLKVFYLSLGGMNTTGMLRVLMDAFYGFAPSLCVFEAHLRPLESEDEGEHSSPMSPILNGESVVMYRLVNLLFTSSVAELLDYRLLQFCPNLTEMVVSLDRYMDSRAAGRSWPVLHMPFLTRLMLSGRAVHLFDPASLHGMPQLQLMRFSPSWLFPKALAVESVFVGRWTWDWDLPRLTDLYVRDQSLAATFNFRLLRGCPKLRCLSVQFSDSVEEIPQSLDIELALPSHTLDIFPALKDLRLTGQYRLQLEDLKALVGRVLPGLQSFYLGTVKLFTAQQILELTKHHPSLDKVTFQHAPVDEARLRELGLVQHWNRNMDIERCLYMFEDENGQSTRYRLLNTL